MEAANPEFLILDVMTDEWLNVYNSSTIILDNLYSFNVQPGTDLDLKDHAG